MAVTDLTGTKWKLKNVFTCQELGAKDFNFTATAKRTSSGQRYAINPGHYITFGSNNLVTLSQFNPPGSYALVSKRGDDGKEYWSFAAASSTVPVQPPEIEITGGEGATDADVIAWFETNATQIIDPPTGLYGFLSDIGLLRVFEKLKEGFEQRLSGKANKVPSATQYNVALFDEHGDLYDGGVSMDDRATMRGWKDSETSWGTYIEQDQGGENQKSFGFMNSSAQNLLAWQMWADGGSVNKLIPTKEYVDGKAGISFEVGAEKWYGTYTDEDGVTYQVYSKTVYIPALPSEPGITTYPHDVANIKQILSIYGFTTDGFVLNAPRQNAQDNIAIYQASRSASNQTFSIEVGKDRSNKKAYVTMIYAKNN